MKKSTVITLHVVFWLVMILFSILPSQIMKMAGYPKGVVVGLYALLLWPIGFYFGYMIVFPLIKRWKSIVIGIIITLVILGVLYAITPKGFAYTLYVVNSLFFYGILGGALKVAIDWFTKKNQNLTLERENLESKLGMLRAQVSPHFLFNTLHNIDGLIMDNQKAASDSLIKLSEVLRYQLYDSRPAESVTLQQEIDHINKYLDLQKMRIKNPEYYSMDVVGSTEKVKVAPLLFIPFIENAFKHCSETKDGKTIDIRFSIVKGKVSFSCENAFDATNTDKDSASGIGLENVKQRLNLIYPGQHKLVISTENSTFRVELEIEPHDH